MMVKLRNNQSGFTVVEILLVLIFVAIVAFTGFYVANNHKSTSTQTTPAKTSQTTTKPAATPATPTASAPQVSDTDQIVVAVKAYTGAGTSQQDATVDTSKIVIDGANASGSVGFPNGGGGASFIAHKSNNSWQVVWEGQQAPGSSIGTKYGLPSSWYSTDYQ